MTYNTELLEDITVLSVNAIDTFSNSLDEINVSLSDETIQKLIQILVNETVAHINKIGRAHV